MLSKRGWTDEVVAQEVDATLRAVRLSPNNESSWNYLRGYVCNSERFGMSFLTKGTLYRVVHSHGSSLHTHQAVVAAVQELKEDGTAHALALWLDILIGQAELTQAQQVHANELACKMTRHTQPEVGCLRRSSG